MSSCTFCHVTDNVPSGDEQSAGRLVAADLDQDVLGVLGQPRGVGRVVGADGLEERLLVLPVEGRLANQHLVQQDPKGPPVDGEGVLLSQQDLMTSSHKSSSSSPSQRNA